MDIEVNLSSELQMKDLNELKQFPSCVSERVKCEYFLVVVKRGVLPKRGGKCSIWIC